MNRDPHDSLAIEVGDRLELADGSIVTVDSNPHDGVWLFCTFVSGPDQSLVGKNEQPVYGTDVAKILQEDER